LARVAVFASAFYATSSAALYAFRNCCVTTIFRRSSMFLDDFDDVDEVRLLMIDA